MNETQRPLLFTPIQLRDVTARNRIVVSPMCQYASDDGQPGDWQLVHLGRFAIGGAGIIFGEETAVEARGRKTYDCAGLWSDAQIPAYRRINDFLTTYGAQPAVQLGHSGRKGSCHDATTGWRPLTKADAAQGLTPWEPIGPSPIAKAPGSPVPREMSVADIKQVTAAFADAARRANDAGFEICEIHGAHGYLIHQFLSPLSNQRGDIYGGRLANRMRFALEVAEAVRSAWPHDKPLFFRVSAVDGARAGWTINDTIALARALKQAGVDVIDCSSGGISAASADSGVPLVPGYQVPFAQRVKHEAEIQTMAVGLIRDGDQAEALLQAGQADLVALARELLWHGDWPAHTAQRMGIPGYDISPGRYAHRLMSRDRYLANPDNFATPENYEKLSTIAGVTVHPDKT